MPSGFYRVRMLIADPTRQRLDHDGSAVGPAILGESLHSYTVK